MKKIFLLLGIAAALGLSACGGMQDTQAAPVEQAAAAQSYKAVLNVDGHKLPVTLRNEPSAADLYSRLPVTLEFKDFSGMEPPAGGRPVRLPAVGQFKHFLCRF